MNSKNIAKAIGTMTLVALVFFSITAFRQDAPSIKKTVTDTIPKSDKKIRDLDEALQELDKSRLELDQQMKKMDWQKMEKDLQNSFKNIDGQKMKLELEKAMQQVDAAKMKADMEASLSKVDFEKIKKEMEKMKEIDFSKIQENIKKIQPELERSMKEAQESMVKAKAELSEYKTFVDDLEKDGLINKKEDYTIEIKKESLTINDKLQPEAVYNKYRSFLEKHVNQTIKKSADGFNIKKN